MFLSFWVWRHAPSRLWANGWGKAAFYYAQLVVDCDLPGLAIFVTTLAINLMATRWRDWLDPHEVVRRVSS